MINSISEKEINEMLTQIKHPVIECDIVRLGIVKKIRLKNNTATIILAFPFIGVPAKDIQVRKEIIGSVKKTIENLGLEIELKQAEMTSEEFNAFLTIEQELWKDYLK